MTPFMWDHDLVYPSKSPVATWLSFESDQPTITVLVSHDWLTRALVSCSFSFLDSLTLYYNNADHMVSSFSYSLAALFWSILKLAWRVIDLIFEQILPEFWLPDHNSRLRFACLTRCSFSALPNRQWFTTANENYWADLSSRFAGFLSFNCVLIA